MRTAVTARSWLFTPGDRERLFDKASASPADAVVLDLEDADVAWARKVLATAVDGGVGTDAAGQMVDKPVVDRARRIVQAAGEDR